MVSCMASRKNRRPAMAVRVMFARRSRRVHKSASDPDCFIGQCGAIEQRGVFCTQPRFVDPRRK